MVKAEGCIGTVLVSTKNFSSFTYESLAFQHIPVFPILYCIVKHSF